jgi:hypothetical protein
LARLTYRPVDDRPAPKGIALVLRVMTMVVLAASLLGMIWIMLDFAATDDDFVWSYEPDRIRNNFHALLTTEERRAIFEQRRAQWQTQQGIIEIPSDISPGTTNDDDDDDFAPPRFDDDDRDNGDEPEPGTDRNDVETYLGGTTQTAEARRNRDHEMRLAESLNKEPYFDIVRETGQFIEWTPFEDSNIERSINEWTAYGGRQAPVYERLALQVLNRVTQDPAGLQPHIETGAYFWGASQDALDHYRGRAFQVEGRLFDLYEVTPPEPVVLPDGTSIRSYYEGVIALLGPGVGRNEHPIEQRVVLFQSLGIPDDLRPFVGDPDGVSHTDLLVTEDVMVSVAGPYVRRWVYSREVKPFSTRARRVRTQAHLPLLLTPQVERTETKPYELTNELLHQVRDSLREAPEFLETEGAYYAILAKANNPEDVIETLREVGYFDLIGEESGPRYRGQGLHVEGMIGDDYVPVILPPNISGLRRVFRAYVLNDLFDLESERLFLVDMIEAPTGLEPRALVRFDGRYYRNVFETDSTYSKVRPLLIVRQVGPYARDTTEQDLFWAAIGVSGLLLLMIILSYFVISDRRERKAFEQSTLELSRKRLEKRGGLKLKPLPGGPPKPPESSNTEPDKQGDQDSDDKADDKPDAKPDDKPDSN